MTWWKRAGSPVPIPHPLNPVLVDDRIELPTDPDELMGLAGNMAQSVSATAAALERVVAEIKRRREHENQQYDQEGHES